VHRSRLTALAIDVLEALGATRVEQVRRRWVMRDPAGLVFCVVPPQTDDFPGDAAVWE
jgi:hypothetical protein